MDDQVIPDFNRPVVVETIIPQVPRDPPPAAPVYLPIPVVYSPPPRVEPVVSGPGDIPLAEPNNPAPAISLFTVGDPIVVASTNLAPDISTYVSSNEPYFQLSGTIAPVVPDTWYEYPTQTGSVLFNNTLPLPVPTPGQGELHAFGASVFYNASSLMPSTWYLNPSLNGEITLVDASGSQLLHSIDANLYYNNELLAKANDIQNIADWSLYPALATVDFNNFGITGASNLTAATANIDTLNAGGIVATGGINAGISGVICGGINTNGVGPVTSGAVTSSTITTSGAGTFGSVSTTGSGTFGSITSNGIINAASHQVQNATAVTIGPGAVGTLSSPDGTVLTWNGNAITTGTGGDVSQWSTFSAVSTINANGNAISNATSLTGATGLAMSATLGDVSLTSVAGNVTTVGALAINNTAGTQYNVLVDRGTNIAALSSVNLTAQNGGGGQVNLTANPAQLTPIPGVVNITANGGQVTLPTDPPTTVTVGGLINIDANTGTPGGIYTATSAIKMSAAGIDVYAGAIPPVASLLGYLFQFGNLGVSVCAGLPSSGFQFPGTVYIYGVGIPGVAGGVRLQSPQGIQMLSDTYIENLYPLDGNGLTIQGRSLPTGYVYISNVQDFSMQDSTSILKTDRINSVSNGGIFYSDDIVPFPGTGKGLQANTLKPPPATAVGAPNLVISGNPNLFGQQNYVQIQNADTIAFDVSGAGAMTGVQTINGVAYPPPLPPIGDVADWALFPAKQAVDMSGNGITNLASIATLTNASITSAGSLSIFSDAADLSLAADNGGNVNIGTGNAGSINIQTAGMGNNITMSGDTASITGATDTNITALGGNVNIVASVAVSLQAPVTVGAVPAPQDIALYGNLNASADVVSSSGTNNYSLNTIGALVGGIPSGFRDATEFYVSFDGSDTTGLGSILSPYKTIQKAITQAELISSAANVCVINVASGHYTENLTFAKGYVILSGSLQSQTGNEVCEITGSISIACVGANDVFNRQVTFQGFNITCGFGQVITDTSTSSHTVTFQDCKCYIVNQFFVSTSTAADMRFYLTNVEVSQTSVASVLPVISTNLGLLEFERLDVSILGNCSAIVVGGTSVLNRFSLSTLDSANAGTTLLPLLSITSTTTSTQTLGNVSFAFTSVVAKTATNAMYIASSINTAILMLNCVFTLGGTASSTNNCIGYNGVGSPTIAGINNTSLNVNVLLPQTTSVQSGITQIQYTNIQPPGLATYSSTADQVIAVAGTPQALTYNTTQFNQGTTLVASSRVYANAQGNYALSYSVELQHAGGGAAQLATIFLKKNGTTIANTGRQWTITSGSTQLAAPGEFVVSLNAGDYVEVFFNGDTNLSANATAAAGALPAIPSVVFNIKQFR